MTMTNDEFRMSNEKSKTEKKTKRTAMGIIDRIIGWRGASPLVLNERKAGGQTVDSPWD
jgi:hypothetical protein